MKLGEKRVAIRKKSSRINPDRGLSIMVDRSPLHRGVYQIAK